MGVDSKSSSTENGEQSAMINKPIQAGRISTTLRPWFARPYIMDWAAALSIAVLSTQTTVLAQFGLTTSNALARNKPFSTAREGPVLPVAVMAKMSWSRAIDERSVLISSDTKMQYAIMSLLIKQVTVAWLQRYQLKK